MTTTITPEEADPIQRLRDRIDELDVRIMHLIGERATLSAQVQEHRLASGGVRLALDRERAILSSYRTALGEAGTALAQAILQACRGRR